MAIHTSLIMINILIALSFSYITCTSSSNTHMLSYTFLINKNKKISLGTQLHLEFLSKTDLCIGTPYSCKTIQFIPNTYLTSFLIPVNIDPNGPNLIKRVHPNSSYDKTLSTSFAKYFDAFYGFHDEMIYDGTHCIDKIQFNPLQLDPLHFYLSTHWSPMQYYSLIGLLVDLRINSYPSFIKQLKNNSIIDTYEYSIEFNNDTEGVIDFGRDPKLSHNQYKKELEIKLENSYHPLLHYYTIKRLYIGNANDYESNDINVLGVNNDTVFDEAFGYIQLTLDLKDAIYRVYLSDLDCTEEVINLVQYRTKTTIYSHYLCNKQRYEDKIRVNNGTDIPDVVFQFAKGDLVLRREDLYMEYDADRVRFMIIFTHTNVTPLWIIGWPLMRRYRVHHNFDDLTIGFYTYDSNMKDVKEMKVFSNLIIIIDIVLGFGLGLNSVLLLWIIPKKAN